MKIMLKSKIVRETLKAKGYDLNQVEMGRAVIDEDLKKLLEKLAEDKPVIKEKGKEKGKEVTILRRKEADGGEDSRKENKSGEKEVVQTLVAKNPEDILERTRIRRKKVAIKDEAEHLGLGQESGSGPQRRKMLKKKNCPESVKNGMKT